MKEWLLGLPISTRLYTSVIPWNCEIWALKVSYPTDLSPTTLFSPVYVPVNTCVVAVGAGGGVYPGWGYGVGLGGLYRYPTQTIPGPIFKDIPEIRPYPRPNEALLTGFHEVS